ncbi:MAG: hypothetical protein HFI70_05525 [Lachnospiraceae bacterium]|nr:hypothetical protein [Lachnospiraceae bacterium]
MKKKTFALLFCSILLYFMLPFTASADTGPKPSVIITFENMGDELCYGTLLSETDSTGPFSAWNGEERLIENYDLDLNIWRAFAEYQDSDGYFFLQQGWLCSESKKLEWTYYPPSRFKILLYYPESNTFAVSGIYERYAFDSYYKVNMEGISTNPSEKTIPLLTAEKNYNLTWELISLFCRIIITILLELGAAFLFGMGKKNFLIWIGIINIITQVLLNLTLNFTLHFRGSMSFILSYLLLECLVFIIESALYLVLFPKISQKHIPQWKIILYTFCANTLSLAGGMIVAKCMPVIF